MPKNTGLKPLEKDSKIKNYKINDSHYGPGYDLTPKVIERPKIQPFFQHNNGQGARNFLLPYLDEILEKPGKPVIIEVPSNIKKSFEDSTFDEKVNHPHLATYPLSSQVARQELIFPSHTTEKRQRIVDVCKKLKRNDGGFVRCRLNREGIDDDLLRQISESLARNLYMQHLMLHDNAITDEGVGILSQAIRFHPSIATIWLGANQIGDLGARHISHLLKLNHNVKELNISNKWPKPATWTGAEQLVHPHITYIGAELIAKQLMNCCGLTYLNLAHQRVRDIGTKAIMQSVNNSNLLVLSLKANEITDDACEEMKLMFQKNPKLLKLDLSHNLIACRGATVISLGLSSNSIIKSVDLGYNKINDDGMKALTQCLTYNFTLTTLITISNISNDDIAQTIIEKRSDSLNSFENNSNRLDYEPPLTPGTSSRLDAIASGQSFNRTSTALITILENEKEAEIEHNELFDKEIESFHSPIKNIENTELFLSPWKSGTPKIVPNINGIEVGGRRVTTSEGAARARSAASAHDNGQELMILPTPPPSREENDIALRRSYSIDYDMPRDRHGRMQQMAFAHLFPNHDARFDHHDDFKPTRRSEDIGKTIGVPNVGNIGVMPLRGEVSRMKDTGQHMLYLRVATPDDPPDMRPYSLVKVGADYRDERARIKAERQTTEYKLAKIDYFRDAPIIKQQLAAMKHPPDYFWKLWKLKMRADYPKGIDNTRGCTSIRNEGFGEKDNNISLFDKVATELLEIGNGSNKNGDPPRLTKLKPSLIDKTPKFSSAGTRLAKKRIAREKQAITDKIYAKNSPAAMTKLLMGGKETDSFIGLANGKGGLTSKSNVDVKYKGKPDIKRKI